MYVFLDVPTSDRWQQPATNSGLPAPLDWAIFISLLFAIGLGFYRQILKSGDADQKVLETLIQDLRDSNKANSDKLAEIAVRLGQEQAEEASVIFRVRATEQKLDALHRRLDLSGTPSSHPEQNQSSEKKS